MEEIVKQQLGELLVRTFNEGTKDMSFTLHKWEKTISDFLVSNYKEHYEFKRLSVIAEEKITPQALLTIVDKAHGDSIHIIKNLK